ncbi:MAG: alpha/beta fold hydrolase [Vicinamibacterales bacterium]
MADHVVVDGVTLEARWWPAPAPGPAAPIVLLHEGLGSVSLWRDFPAGLAAATSRPVFAYSRRGYGRSAARGRGLALDFMETEAAVVPRVLDAAGIGRAVLFGHSDGGSIALVAAAAVPDRIEALVVEAPHVFVEDVSVASIARMRDLWTASDLRARLARHHQHVDEAFLGWNGVWLDPAFRAWTIEPALQRVVCPTLILQGVDDEYGTVAQVEAITAQAAGTVETALLPRCGHSPHRDRPADVLARTAAFLARSHGTTASQVR